MTVYVRGWHEAEIVLDSEERAEMLAAIRDMDAGDEAFAGQY